MQRGRDAEVLMQPNEPLRRERIQQELHPTLVAEPLRSQLVAGDPQRHHVIVELNTLFPGGLETARARVRDSIANIAAGAMDRNIPGARNPFVFAELTSDQIGLLLAADGALARSVQASAQKEGNAAETRVVDRRSRAIFKIWESALIQPLTTVSIRTVKADAAQAAFAAFGNGIVWAVLDSGIDGNHPHFAKYGNLNLELPLEHKSFALTPPGAPPLQPLEDGFGHGTHVAGIIAGASNDGRPARAAQQSVDEGGLHSEFHVHDVAGIRGMAPMCKLLSLRVLNDAGIGDTTAVINALEWIIQINGDGSQPLVHGVNISAGYLADPENYGSGQSPICRQVDRAVKSGIVVVAAAGNYGYTAYNAVQAAGAVAPWAAGQLASIADPANADLAISVGSTHREEPHRYGISYFSSKGPTSDGRAKPDVVAPGERIISCAAGAAKHLVEFELGASGAVPPPDFDYIEDTGTSMAAPHVAGVIAAFLSIRREFIGEPGKVAELVTSSAMDLKRDPRLQGAGLVDLFRMLQTV
jgi:subtilisin family serine protease